MIYELTEKNFDENIKDGLKLVIFSTPWCKYCQMQKPVLEELKDIKIGDINAEESPNITNKYGIKAFPTFVLFKSGKEVIQFAGFHKKSDLLKKLTDYMN